MKGDDLMIPRNQIVLAQYQNQLFQTRNKRSAMAYFRDVERFIETLTTDIRHLTANEVQTYLHQLATQPQANGQPLKGSSLRRRYTSLTNFCEYLKEQGIQVENLMKDIKAPKTDRVSEVIDYLTEEEIKKLIQVAEELNEVRFVRQRDCLMIRLSVETGLRPNELIKMTFSQLDFANQLITIVSQEGSVRQVPMSEGLKQEMEAYLKERKKIPTTKATRHLVFATTKGGIYTTQLIHGALTRYCEGAGVKRANSTIFRHTYAYNLIQQGKSLEEMARLLGHASVYTVRENYEKWMK